jgi:uncharacterized protein (DUF924 family)
MSSSTLNLRSPSDVILFWYGGNPKAEGAFDSKEALFPMMKKWYSIGGEDPVFSAVQRSNESLIARVASGARTRPMGAKEEDGKYHDAALDWGKQENHPESLLAAVLVLDQFPRTVFRGTPQAFVNDEIASTIVMNVMKNKGDQYILDNFTPVERMFLATSLQHSETSEGQALSLQMAELVPVGDKSGIVDVRAYCESHAMVIEQFGRFPGRNNALGRESTKEEIEWLESPDCPEWAKSQLAPKK